ncbi:MAG TPA: molybdopterin-dependent oxidoreductase [Chloroflexi bacterium]|nr:MAG: aldehyde oxidase [Anaerolineaceae bacterium 4572_5.2]HEY83508.1 molybdopterin-dependent oxidoreductase [Chloroflexota bacterium]
MTHKFIGQSINRLDAWGKVTGETLYPGDQNHNNQFWLKVHFAKRVHTRILSIDTAAAEALPGVVLVLTAKDVPVNEYGLQTPDQPVLCGPGSSKEGADVARFVGDQIAVVVAVNEKIAAKACDLINVEYEDLPAVTDPFAAMEEDAPQLHPHCPDNIATHDKIRRGDTDSAWEQCDIIIENTYHTPWQEHAYLQPEAGTAYIDDEGRIAVACAGQWAWEEQEQIAHALALPSEKVRVIHDAIGGAFGGREDISVQIILGLAVYKLQQRGVNRPVKIVWSREESIIGHCKRHPMTIQAKWGAKQDGTLVAVESKIVSDGGAYMYTSNKVLANAIMTVGGPYYWPHAKMDAFAVYTNNIPGGAFRGFGGPQAQFAAEGQMNKLAEALGMDPVEIRMKNLLDEEKPLTVGTPIPGGISLKTVLEKTALAAGWTQQDGYWLAPEVDGVGDTARGTGITLGFKNIGFSLGYPENSWAGIELLGDAKIEEAVLSISGSDVGQGHHTAMTQIAAEALDIPIDRITLVAGDTAYADSAGSASASRLTFMAGNAVKGAAEEALQRWQNEERPVKVEYTYYAPKTTTFDPETGECMPNFAYGYVCETVELTVDTETGFITVQRVICANDVGKAINPEQVIGQIEGAIVQAHGYTILEEFQTKNGEILTPNLSTYLIPGISDIPERVESIIVEDPHPEGPYGARGMAEMPYLIYAPAVTAAVHNATGIWFDQFPLTPERVLRALGKLE